MSVLCQDPVCQSLFSPSAGADVTIADRPSDLKIIEQCTNVHTRNRGHSIPRGPLIPRSDMKREFSGVIPKQLQIEVLNQCHATVFSGVHNSQPQWTGGLEVPKIRHPEDCIIRVLKTTICGTDLHIYKGLVASANDALADRQAKEGEVGLRTGHEGIGLVVEVGSGVKKISVGQRVLVSCISHCGTCEFCSNGHYGNCTVTSGWILGNVIDGMQGQYARVPFCDFSTVIIEEDYWDTPIEDALVLCSDILPTGFEIGLLDGFKCLQSSSTTALFTADDEKEEIKLKDLTLCFVGAGPVGLGALMIAVCVPDYNHMISKVIVTDLNERRLQVARDLVACGNERRPPGSRPMECVVVPAETNESVSMQIDSILDNTRDRNGVDMVIEAIGSPTGWGICQNVTRPGGHISILGVHGRSATINLERLWYSNYTFSAGMVHGYTTRNLMEWVKSGALPAHLLISHYLKLSDSEKAYEMFARGIENNALKILLYNDQFYTSEDIPV